MKLFNLYVGTGDADVSEEFKTDGARIEAARSYLFNANDGQQVFRLTLDHNGNPNVSDFTDEDLNGEGYDPLYDVARGELWEAAEQNDIDNPHSMDDSMHGLV